MTLTDIKHFTDNDVTVHWSNESYKVVKTVYKSGNIAYNIKHTGGHCIGLTKADNVTLNGKEEDFFIVEENVVAGQIVKVRCNACL